MGSRGWSHKVTSVEYRPGSALQPENRPGPAVYLLGEQSFFLPESDHFLALLPQGS